MKRIDIEALLKWAFCEELPKDGAPSGGGGLGGWAPVNSFFQLLTVVDDNRYGVVPFLDVNAGEVHPDAIAVHAAVVGLDYLTLEIPEGWNPMPELDVTSAHGAMALRAAIDKLTVIEPSGQRTLRKQLPTLVRKHALLGGCPGEGEWNCHTPKLVAVCGQDGGPIWFRKTVQHVEGVDGKPVEHIFETEDGWDRSRGRAKRGAYQKFHLDPDPVPVLVARGEYELWRAGLIALVDDLSMRLEEHEVTVPTRPAAPWDQNEAANAPRKPVVLRDLRIFS